MYEVMSIHASPWAQTCAVNAEGNERDEKDQRRDQHVIGLGQPSGQPHCPEHDCQERRSAANRRDHGTDDAGSDEGAVAHVAQLLGADG